MALSELRRTLLVHIVLVDMIKMASSYIFDTL